MESLSKNSGVIISSILVSVIVMFELGWFPDFEAFFNFISILLLVCLNVVNFVRAEECNKNRQSPDGYGMFTLAFAFVSFILIFGLMVHWGGITKSY